MTARDTENPHVLCSRMTIPVSATFGSTDATQISHDNQPQQIFSLDTPPVPA